MRLEELGNAYGLDREDNNRLLSFLAEKWVADVLQAQMAPSDQAAYDIWNSVIFPGMTFQVKLAKQPFCQDYKDRRQRPNHFWSWSEGIPRKAHEIADWYILGGVALDRTQIIWFVLPSAVWFMKAGKSEKWNKRSLRISIYSSYRHTLSGRLRKTSLWEYAAHDADQLKYQIMHQQDNSQPRLLE